MDTYLSDFVYNFISCSFRLMCANLQEFMRFLISTFSSFFFSLKINIAFFLFHASLNLANFLFILLQFWFNSGCKSNSYKLLSKLLNVFLNIYTLFETKKNFCFPSNFGIKHLPNILIFRRIKIRISKLPSSISYFHASWSRYRVEDIFFTGD